MSCVVGRLLPADPCAVTELVPRPDRGRYQRADEPGQLAEPGGRDKALQHPRYQRAQALRRQRPGERRTWRTDWPSNISRCGTSGCRDTVPVRSGGWARWPAYRAETRGPVITSLPTRLAEAVCSARLGTETYGTRSCRRTYSSSS